MLKNKVAKNAGWIIVCKVVQSLLSLVIGSLTARYLGPSNYGLINYASSIVAFVVPIMYLGINNVLVQELITHENEEGEVIGTSITLSACSAVLCIVGVAFFVLFVNASERDTIIVSILYSILLIFQSFDLIQYWFQAKFLAKYTSITMLVVYVIVSAYKAFLLITAKSVYWFALSSAIDYFLIAAILMIIYKKLGGQKLSFSFSAAKRIFSKSKYYIVSSLMVTIFAKTDSVMIKLMISNEANGYYSAAVTCAGVTGFVFAAIIDSARPSIFESENVSVELFEKNVVRLYSVIIYFSLLQCIGITVFAKLMVYIIYGKSYFDAVAPLRIIVWYTTFSYLGSVRNIWILAEQKQQYLWIINLSGALANVALNFVLIPVLGINGAAIASLITQIFTNVIVGFIIKPIRRNNYLMLKGLNPKNIVELAKKINSK